MTQKGFTLIELIIVISIISLLAVVGISSFSNVQKNGRDAKRKADLSEIKKALVQYYTDTSTYPAGTATGAMCNPDCGQSQTNPTNWIVGLTPTYADILPVDPLNTATYHYLYDRLPGGGFRLSATLEKDGSVYQIRTQ